ncbi:hypothetical protein MTO96_019162 [Rhipicephalus appendiculatus]
MSNPQQSSLKAQPKPRQRHRRGREATVGENTRVWRRGGLRKRAPPATLSGYVRLARESRRLAGGGTTSSSSSSSPSASRITHRGGRGTVGEASALPPGSPIGGEVRKSRPPGASPADAPPRHEREAARAPRDTVAN